MKNHHWLAAYLLQKPGATTDYKIAWGWQRYQVHGKMFAATMRPAATHAPEYAEKDLLNLKCDPLLAELYRKEYPNIILPGFYCNKRCWNSVVLNDDLPDALLRQMCDHSYQLVFEKLTKKLQRELLENRSDADVIASK